jgi:hypothetical protein
MLTKGAPLSAYRSSWATQALFVPPITRFKRTCQTL